MLDFKKLPVYAQKEKILSTLYENRAIVVQSPTGSGKTTQIPVILHEAGFSENGIIAVTQPRRIAALSVSEFISKQLKTKYPGLVGYKMRFEDKTDATTKIKIMTDGILLQEMKLDPWLSKYSVVMIDEAHERSLNIDFVLGLLKRILDERKDFKVIVSSATMNAQAFGKYFGNCPIVTIDTQVFPVAMIYEPSEIPTSTATESSSEALMIKIESILRRVVQNGEKGDVLIFLPGEKIIRQTIKRLSLCNFHSKIFLVPLFGRLAKEEQEKVFLPAPFGKKKVVVSTNIAETSVTINGITTVIDSGLSKQNFYNPNTFTSSLVEVPVSKASCNQRRGRAGRTQSGICYRLYSRKDFEKRPLWTTEEILRSDLSEVILRMSELGITNFENFDFISKPDEEGIKGAIETLNFLGALNKDRTLSSIGKMMVKFPLEPRISRIIVESLLRFPNVLYESLIAAAFLSAQSPFVLPAGEELEARKAHHSFRDEKGDFVAYIKIFDAYTKAKKRAVFCKKNFLDERVMAEIENIKLQLEEIVGNLGFPIIAGGKTDDFLCCISAGMIQFVCVKTGREIYKSLTEEHISIHPGSSMFRENPDFFVAGEIIKTSRIFASSVSPLTKEILERLDKNLFAALKEKYSKSQRKKIENEKHAQNFNAKQNLKEKNAKNREFHFGDETFDVKKIKGKNILELPFEKFQKALKKSKLDLSEKPGLKENFRARLFIKGKDLFSNERLGTILKVAKNFSLYPLEKIPKNFFEPINLAQKNAAENIAKFLPFVMRATEKKAQKKAFGWTSLSTDGKIFRYQISKNFSSAANETLFALETLADAIENEKNPNDAHKKINTLYRALSEIFS